MSFTTDSNNEKLTHGIDDKPVEQAEVYLILSDEERAKGFVRPVRTSYVHTGIQPKRNLRELTEEEKIRYKDYNYVAFEEYPESKSCVDGRFWTEKQLNSGCGGVTTMARELAETYARDPKFYGATYCCHCQKHLPVAEFRWVDDNSIVGS